MSELDPSLTPSTQKIIHPITHTQTMSSVSAFLAEFVDPAMHDQARDAMSALFAQLHVTLARDFFNTYAALAPLAPLAPPAPPAPPPAKKKKTEVQALPCSAVTAKGEACPRRCCADAPDTFCATHLAQSLKPAKEPKAPTLVSKKAARAAVPICSGKTAKDGACTRKCCAESDVFCSTHLAQSLKPAKASGSKAKKEKATPAAKKTKVAKPVKPIPTHNHALTEEVEANCDLCQTHGNAADPELTETQFEEISGDLQSRLQSILANLHEVEDEEEEAEEFEAEEEETEEFEEEETEEFEAEESEVEEEED